MQLGRPESKIHKYRVHRALRHAEVLFVERDGHVLIDAVANVSHHVLLEGDGLELDLLLYFLGCTLQLELLRPAMVQQVAEHELHFHDELSLVER